MFISNVSILAVRPHHWHHPVFEHPICWSFDFVLVLLFTTYYFDKLAIAFGIKSVLAMLVLIILIPSLALAVSIYRQRYHNL